ncbi:gag polymerase env [Lasallia pustulata]|uniref:Gag polymerase env n=1 Tax=Lasallia pustulata TaxID=136370 RepID=A0A1W5CRQ1_9LECA|nr:gag polymerase env [Lasallia pustulata]
MNARLLQYFDENKPMRVETDTSAFVIGRILAQQFEIDSHLHWLPVAYYSKKLLDMETQYGIGKKNPANSVSRRPDYKLLKASTTLTAAETVQQSFRLGSNDYKPVQEKLYTLAVMTLRPRRPVQQVQQEDVVPNINIDVGIEDSGAATAEESSVQHLPAQEASRDGDDVRRPGYPEAQHRSIEDSTADAEAMDIDNTVGNDPIGLQIEAGTADEMAESLRLMATHTPIGGKATAYITSPLEKEPRPVTDSTSVETHQLIVNLPTKEASALEEAIRLAGIEEENLEEERETTRDGKQRATSHDRLSTEEVLGSHTIEERELLIQEASLAQEKADIEVRLLRKARDKYDRKEFARGLSGKCNQLAVERNLEKE